MKRNSDRLLRLINQLLDLRKVDNNGFVLNINKVNIYTVIEDIYLSFKEEAERKSINYSFTNKINNDILLFIDQDILNKTLYNIISKDRKSVV